MHLYEPRFEVSCREFLPRCLPRRVVLLRDPSSRHRAAVAQVHGIWPWTLARLRGEQILLLLPMLRAPLLEAAVVVCTLVLLLRREVHAQRDRSRARCERLLIAFDERQGLLPQPPHSAHQRGKGLHLHLLLLERGLKGVLLRSAHLRGLSLDAAQLRAYLRTALCRLLVR